FGSSETVGTSCALFNVVDKQTKIYSKPLTAVRHVLDISAPYELNHQGSETLMQKPNEGPSERVHALKTADKVIVGRYAPAGVIVNADLEIVEFRGHTGPFLDPSPGEAKLDLLTMVRQTLLLELR